MGYLLTLDILDGDTVLNVLNKLAFTPGGGSKVTIRETRNRFTGTYSDVLCTYVSTCDTFDYGDIKINRSDILWG